MEKLNVNGIDIHYQKTGSGEPIIFIPGSISDYRTWNPIREEFAKHYECYLLSRRFQHPSQYIKGGDSSVHVNTHDIAQFMKEKQISPAMVVGHSYGGFIALNLAMQYSHLVKCVIAEEPMFAPVIIKNPKNPFNIMGLMYRNSKAGKSFARLGMKGTNPALKAIKSNDLITAQKKFIDGLTDGKKTPDTLDTLTRLQLIDNMTTFAGEGPFNNKITPTDLEKIRCKVLLINGSASPYIFHYINHELKKRIPDAEHLCINNVDHWVHVEKSEEFTKVVLEFLRR